MVVVTGSRLVTRAVDSPAPITVISGEQILGQTGRTSLGDELTELPQFRATLTQSVSGGIGVTPPSQVGLNLLDLRGLGTVRTLVLQNGRRHVSGSQLVAQPDINTIPLDLLERVEILTGGASAVYGADAIAGVVNFVLKENFEGLTFRGQGGVSGHGDADTRQLSVTAGSNFGDGRGNIAGSIAYDRRDLLPYSARAFSRGQSAFVPNSADTDPSLPPGSAPDGIPDQILINDLRLLFLSTGGTFFNNFMDGTPRFFRFAPDGTLNPADFGERGFFPPVPVSEGGDGYSSIATSTLLPQNEHVSLNLIGHFDISDRLRLFTEVKAVHQEAKAFGQATASGLELSVDNPFLSDQARGVLEANLPPGSTSFFIQRVNEDLGNTGERSTRKTARGVLGLKGDFSEHWRFETAYSYGRTKIDTDFLNGIFPRRLELAADAVTDSAGVLGAVGATVCSSRLAAGGVGTGDVDVDNCVAANVFGNGAISAAARDYIGVTTEARGVLTQNLIHRLRFGRLIRLVRPACRTIGYRRGSGVSR